MLELFCFGVDQGQWSHLENSLGHIGGFIASRSEIPSKDWFIDFMVYCSEKDPSLYLEARKLTDKSGLPFDPKKFEKRLSPQDLVTQLGIYETLSKKKTLDTGRADLLKNYLNLSEPFTTLHELETSMRDYIRREADLRSGEDGCGEGSVSEAEKLSLAYLNREMGDMLDDLFNLSQESITDLIERLRQEKKVLTQEQIIYSKRINKKIKLKLSLLQLMHKHPPSKLLTEYLIIKM